ncbi:hypothetical protein EWB00_001076 [Schistosoma japonicum]|uniref:BTB domain-containing protein n=1 Tax=Schistosoma japonicum TaxID=6182 RepID=A0A4Z2DGU4_SCHJA|nr:hypothetical protein EWB00_001076 [Schistosoma japonicum]TNN15665.1 hypothetical protein EWB00_001076 [Schistosoma japonicum]
MIYVVSIWNMKHYTNSNFYGKNQLKLDYELRLSSSYVVSHNFQDDLSSLAEHGWCFNMYLIHNKSTREAHSYLLASRLSTFDDLLTSLNRGKPHKSSNKAVATTDHIIASTIAATTFFNNTTTSLTNKVSFSTHSSINSLSMSDRLGNQSFNLQPEKFPDLLSSSRLKLQDISSYDINNEMHHDHHRRKLPSVSVISSTSLIANTTTHDISDSSEMFLTNFLSQLYTGNDPKQLLSKPDLLHQPEMKDCLSSCSNLLKLYNFLLSTPQHKCLLSSDCELIFTCPSIFNFKSITLPCHAGILACRSGFLRRILLKRCKSNTTSNTTNNQSSMIHKIILDGTILPAHFSTVLLHFFYCDYLNLNEIANLLLIFNKQTLLNKLHFNWHSEHESSKKSSNHDHYHTCCKVFNNEDHHHLTTSTYSHTYSSSCTESDSGSFFTFIKFLLNTSEFYVKQFCLQCPFCLTHIIQLHPIGAILEFHRLSEVCEDLLAEAMNLSSVISENCDNSNWTNLSTAATTTTKIEGTFPVKMTPISLAVGLLKWIDEKSSSSSQEAFANTQLLRRHNNTAAASDSPTSSQQLRSNSDASSTMDNQFTIKSLDNNSHVSPYNETSFGFVYRHAIQCLRQNFTLLVRSPSTLRRLSPQQLCELLDSSLVQAPESDILAGLLCWAECQLKFGQNTGFDVKSAKEYSRDGVTTSQSDKSLSNPIYIEYQSILSSIIGDSSVIHCNDNTCTPSTTLSMVSKENDHSYFNHWLLLCSIGYNNLEDDMKRPTTSSIDCSVSITSPSCHLCHNTSSTATNNITTNKSSSESFLISHNLNKIIPCIQCIDLISIVSLLNDYHLLNYIQPAHLLSPMPNELANVLLRYYSNSPIHHHQKKNSAHNNSSIPHNTEYYESEALSHSPWNSLIQLTKSSQSICSETQFSFEKILSNPWSLSPAQFSEKYHWASLLTVDNVKGDDNLSKERKLDPVNATTTTTSDDTGANDDCVCCWNKHHLTEDSLTYGSVRKSWSDGSNLWCLNSNRMKPRSGISHPPRLYYPFLNEVRTLFIQKHAVHHQRLHLMKSNSLQCYSQQSSECTCWEFLLSRRFDQSCNLTNSSPNTTTKHIQSSCNKSFNTNHCQQPSYTTTNTTDISRDSHNLSSECDLSFLDLAKKRFGSKSYDNNNDNNNHHNNDFFTNKKFTICCDYKCRDFAYCLLPSSQWTSIIDYYVRLVREFMDDPISHHPCTNNNHIHHILRLRSLWKYGLPDSLENLLICRINEYMFMLQQPRQQYSYTTESCNLMKNNNTLTMVNNVFVTTIPTTNTTTMTTCTSTTSSSSVCNYSIPLIDKISCEHSIHHVLDSMNMTKESVMKTNNPSMVIPTTSVATRSLYSLPNSSNRINNVNKLVRNSNNNHHLASISKVSQSCSSFDKVILSPVSMNLKSSSSNKQLLLHIGSNKSFSSYKLSNNTHISSCCKEYQYLANSLKPCYHNSSCFPSCIIDQQHRCMQCCITSSITNTTTNCLNNLPTYFFNHPRHHQSNCIYSNSDYLLNDSLLSLSNNRTLKKNKSSHRHHSDLCRTSHGHQHRRQQCPQQPNISRCSYKVSSSELTTLSSPCYRKALFDCDELHRKLTYCPYMYSQPLHPASSLSSGISLVHLTSNDSHNRHTTAITTSINSVISSGSNYPVCDGHFASKLKLSTKKCRVNDNYDNHFQNTTYLPLLLTLPCNDNCNNHCHNYISSSFIRKSDPFSESTAYYSSSSSSSSSSSCSSSSSTTGFSPTNSSLLSGRSN